MINRLISKFIHVPLKSTTYAIIALFAVFTLSTAQLPYVHGATPSPGFRSYPGNCFLLNSPSSPQINKGQTLTGDWTTSAGSSCSGVGYVSATAGTIGGLDNFNVASTAEFDDVSFSVPSIGQTNTLMTLSGDYLVLGYVAADGLAVGPGSITTSASLTVNLVLQQTSLTNPGTWTQIYYWTLHGTADWIETCTESIAGSCGVFVANYRIGLQFQPRAIVSTFLAGTGLALSCGDYTNLGTGYDNCNTVPQPINGGNLPIQPTSSCPSGTSSNPCYYVQWIDSTTSLSDNYPSGGGGCGHCYKT